MEHYENVFEAVGHAVLDFGPLELTAHAVARLGIDPLDDSVGRSETAHLRFNWIINKIEALARQGAYEQHVSGINARITEFVNGAREVADRRNELAHSYSDANRTGNLRTAIESGLPLLASTHELDLPGVELLVDRYYKLRDIGSEICIAVRSSAGTSREP